MKREGFSLLEVSLSTIAFMVIALSMFTMFQQGYRNFLTKNKLRIPAYNIARAVIEQYSNWTLLDSLSASAGVVNGTYTKTTNPANLSDVSLELFGNTYSFTRSLVISNGPTNPAELKQITAVVSWDVEGDIKYYNITTLKASY